MRLARAGAGSPADDRCPPRCCGRDGRPGPWRPAGGPSATTMASRPPTGAACRRRPAGRSRARCGRAHGGARRCPPGCPAAAPSAARAGARSAGRSGPSKPTTWRCQGAPAGHVAGGQVRRHRPAVQEPDVVVARGHRLVAAGGDASLARVAEPDLVAQLTLGPRAVATRSSMVMRRLRTRSSASRAKRNRSSMPGAASARATRVGDRQGRRRDAGTGRRRSDAAASPRGRARPFRRSRPAWCLASTACYPTSPARGRGRVAQAHGHDLDEMEVMGFARAPCGRPPPSRPSARWRSPRGARG